MSEQTLKEALERIGPEPDPSDLDEVLTHVLRVYESEPDDRRIITATSNVYGPSAWTGLTWGDLRALAERVGIEWVGGVR